jgi:hypothetical protein
LITVTGYAKYIVAYFCLLAGVVYSGYKHIQDGKGREAVCPFTLAFYFLQFGN